MTLENEVVKDFLREFNALQISFMLVGSFSSNFYGVPRSTEDADFVIELSSSKQLAELQSSLSGSYICDGQKMFELQTGTSKYEFFNSDSRFRVELFLLSDDKHDQSRFARREKIEFMDEFAFVPTPEDVIITKLRWLRAKDREDIKNVLAAQAAKLDWPYIDHWCELHGTLNDLRGIQKDSDSER